MQQNGGQAHPRVGIVWIDRQRRAERRLSLGDSVLFKEDVAPQDIGFGILRIRADRCSKRVVGVLPVVVQAHDRGDGNQVIGILHVDAPRAPVVVREVQERLCRRAITDLREEIAKRATETDVLRRFVDGSFQSGARHRIQSQRHFGTGGDHGCAGSRVAVPQRVDDAASLRVAPGAKRRASTCQRFRFVSVRCRCWYLLGRSQQRGRGDQNGHARQARGARHPKRRPGPSPRQESERQRSERQPIPHRGSLRLRRVTI